MYFFALNVSPVNIMFNNNIIKKKKKKKKWARPFVNSMGLAHRLYKGLASGLIRVQLFLAV